MNLGDEVKISPKYVRIVCKGNNKWDKSRVKRRLNEIGIVTNTYMSYVMRRCAEVKWPFNNSSVSEFEDELVVVESEKVAT